MGWVRVYLAIAIALVLLGCAEPEDPSRSSRLIYSVKNYRPFKNDTISLNEIMVMYVVGVFDDGNFLGYSTKGNVVIASFRVGRLSSTAGMSKYEIKMLKGVEYNRLDIEWEVLTADIIRPADFFASDSIDLTRRMSRVLGKELILK